MSNVITLRRTFSDETSVESLDRQLTEARQDRAQAIRLRDRAAKAVCEIEAQIWMLEAVKASAVPAAAGAVCIDHDEAKR